MLSNISTLSINNDVFIKLTRISFSCIFVTQLFIIAFYPAKQPSVILWTYTCTLWLFLITTGLLFAIWLTDGVAYMVTWLISYIMSVFYYPRFVSYAVFPDHIKLANIPDQISSEDIDKMLMVIAVYIIFISATLITSTHILIYKYSTIFQTNENTSKFNLSTGKLVLLFIIIVLAEHIWSYISGISAYGVLKARNANSVFMFIKLFINQDVFFPILLYLLCCVKNKEYSFFYITLVVFIYTASITMGGSRIGSFRALTYFLFIMTFFSFKVNLHKIAILTAGICLITLFTTHLANYVRVKHSYEASSSMAVQRQIIYELDSTSSIINRFGISDFSTLAISKIDHRSPLLSFKYTVKSILNYILPGLPYKEAPIQQSQLLPMLTGVVDQDYVVKPGSRYHSQPLTVWGQTYISAKLCFGAVLLSLITAFTVLCGLLFDFLSRIFWQARLIESYYYLIIVFGFWNLMAWDQFISNSISLSITFAFYIFIIVKTKLVLPITAVTSHATN